MKLRCNGIIIPILLFLLAVALGRDAEAQQNIIAAHGARSGAMGGCFVLDTARHVAVGYRYLFRDASLADKTLTAVMPTGSLGIVMGGYLHHGNDAYHEQMLNVGYGLKVERWLMVAVGVNYLHVGTNDGHYEAQQRLAPQAAIVASAQRVSLTLAGGTVQWRRQRPFAARLNVVYRPSEDWLSVAEIECDERWRMRCGMEYAYGQLFARAGFATNPLVLSFGVGAKWNILSVDFAAEMHSALGITPNISLLLWF